MKSKLTTLFSSLGALIGGSCGSACGVACLASGCCGGSILFGFIGLSGSTLKFFEKLTPFFLILTIVSLSYAFYKAYKPKPATVCCDDKNEKNFCCEKEKKVTFLQSKSFLWAITILSAIMWIYPYINKLDSSKNSNSTCQPTIQTADSLTVKSCCSVKDTICSDECK